MKEMYPPEVAEYLGYQKYWPEWKDWIFATGAVIAIMAIIIGVAYYIANQTGYTARDLKQRQERKYAIMEWCQTHKEKNLEETKECINY